MQTYVRLTHTHPALDLPVVSQRTTGDATLLRFMLDNFRVDMRNVSSGRVYVNSTLPALATDTPSLGGLSSLPAFLTWILPMRCSMA